MKVTPVIFSLFSIYLLYTGFARAGKPDVLDAGAECHTGNRCNFTVTIRHADEGWNHYVDKWEAIGLEGNVLATRTLHHPHVQEQPFKRTLGNVAIPKNINRVTIRAHDSVHGYG
jgi:hypothetical protein